MCDFSAAKFDADIEPVGFSSANRVWLSMSAGLSCSKHAHTVSLSISIEKSPGSASFSSALPSWLVKVF
jgi:hypothetical protein